MLLRKEVNVDFCVVGGGISGICAAVSAARNGARVALIHERPVLGGNASSEIRMWVCGSNGNNNRETGILEEIALENLHKNPTKNYYIWDTILYGLVEKEPNIELFLNCTCMDAEVEKGNYADNRSIKIKSVTGYQLTTQTFIDVKAKMYADCSGDSILAPLTGADFRIGREANDEFGEDTVVTEKDDMTMGMSCLIQGRETEKEVKYTLPQWAERVDVKHFEARGLDPYHEYENYWYLELGGNRDTIHDTEDINKELIPLAMNAWDYIKNSGKFDTAKWDLDFLGFLPGKRESRRLMGEYLLTQRDVSDNKEFEDVIAYGGWPIDDHFPAGFYHIGAPNTNIPTPAPYGIPYRILYSKNVENLYFAGRNVSVTHMALSSVRVMATCGLMGEAVGTAAAIAVKNGLTPHGVYKEKMSELQNILLDGDCFLPKLKREISDTCVSNTAYVALCDGEDRVHKIYGKNECGVEISNGDAVEYNFNEKTEVKSIHIVFDSDLNRETLPGSFCERYHSMRCSVTKDSPYMTMPKTLCKSFVLEAVINGENKILLEKNENIKRFYHINLNETVEKIRLIPKSNWGNGDKTRILSFDFK